LYLPRGGNPPIGDRNRDVAAALGANDIYKILELSTRSGCVSFLQLDEHLDQLDAKLKFHLKYHVRA
jgi:hypothetical protein